ncbi:MAG TPA: RiPP maturation radical SAM C-methyltransferase [Clostridia bacterium]|nr:RiPP maturation radical SAM C-methyltransferase [Clostridia bacterium]
MQENQESDIRELIELKDTNPFLTEAFNPMPIGSAKAVDEKQIEDELIKVCRKVKNETIPSYFYKLLSETNFSEYDIIGFTCSFSQTAPSISFARIIKDRFRDKVIILGGNGVSGHMGVEYMKVFPWIDYIVYGEGETALSDLVHYLRENDYGLKSEHKLTGIIYREEDGNIIMSPPSPLLEMDEVPAPDYEDYFRQVKIIEKAAGIRLKQDTLLFETARGCWWGEKKQCKFCSLNGENRNFRSKTWETVLENVLQLSERYEKNEFICVDNILSYPALVNLFSALQERNLNLDIFWEVKPNLSMKQLKTLSEAGLKKVQAGIESFSTEVIRLIEKGSTRLKNVQFVRNCFSLGIHVSYNFLFGFPGEKPEYYNDLAGLFPLLHHITPPLYPPRPMILQRFSKYYAEPEENQLKNVRPMKQYSIIYPVKELDIKKISATYSFECSSVPENLDYMNRITEAIGDWNIAFGGKNTPILAYETGVNFVRIYDSRFGRFRSMILRDIPAMIYMLCEEIRPLDRIIKVAREKHADRVLEDEKITNILNVLVSEKLMIMEDGMYLSLAVNLRHISDRLAEYSRSRIINSRLFDEFDELFKK